ncbi:glycosyltransferase family protein [Rhizobium sp. L1K21]|uniref:glycosyltransferase family protein n=1 Tax=Rhizobium sp. L1K21 TaxID=2954933 RepID=UPI002092DAF2|nr:glycosyltransferase [Rhizobium sp. L1K21]MCO6187652.1 glycosyl transferase [Rhizobium sp. L1K21]
MQHLMGVGHVFRSMRIARALVKAGQQVDFVFGGEPVPNFSVDGANIHYLPALRGGRKVFREMEAPDGTVADDAYKQRRTDMLLDIFRQSEPDAIVTETFPLGRRQMRFELLPLLDAARRSGRDIRIFSSVRDILQENWKPERYEEAVGYVEQYFDHILVHGDSALNRLEETFPPATRFAEKLIYTGIVAPEPDTKPVPEVNADVVVSVGGGVLGHELLLAVIDAMALSSMKDARWLIAYGINMDDDTVGRLKSEVGPNVTLVPFVDNLRGVMRQTKLSISRCGYNTISDLFESGTRAVVVPISDGVETEQLNRGEALRKLGFAEVIHPDDLSPQTLAAAIDAAMAKPVPDRSGFDLNGAGNSAQAIIDRLP